MKYIFLDFEASSVNASIAEPYELSGWVVNITDENIHIDKAFSEFFAPIEAVPYAITSAFGTTEAKLNELSNYYTFQDKYEKLKWLWQDNTSTIVIHNVPYDNTLARASLQRIGKPIPRWSKFVDTLSASRVWAKEVNQNIPLAIRNGIYVGKLYSKQSAKLSEVYNGLYTEQERLNQDKVFLATAKSFGVPVAVATAHTALYDSWIMLLVFLKLRTKGFIN